MQQHNGSPPSSERPVPPERRLRVAEVRAAMQVTPHMRRITLASTALMDFPVRRPAQWVKVFVPTAGSETPNGRAYTVRHFRAALCEVDLDFVLHGDGPCSTWALNARPGDVVRIAGPRGGFRLDPEVSHLLIGGDETALPAIGAILEALPAGLTVAAVVEIPENADAQVIHSKADVEITWLPPRWRGHRHRARRVNVPGGGAAALRRSMVCGRSLNRPQHPSPLPARPCHRAQPARHVRILEKGRN